MAKTYVKLGIDHGTSNSAIAVMEPNGPRIVKPDGVNTTLPSVVYISSGGVLVGAPARNAMLSNPVEAGTGHGRYKPYIGQNDLYEFPQARKVMNARELGGLVMRELVKAYQNETKESPNAAVITIPAKFEQSDCEATREAAKLAGLEYAPLVPEPIAASLAYGFSAQDQRAQWIVFDLGGGTLDVSLVIVRNGALVVPEFGNAGDKHLGGSHFDRELMDFVLGPSRSDPNYSTIMDRNRGLQRNYRPLREIYALDNFSEKSKSSAWGTLLLAVEDAKIELSEKPAAMVSPRQSILCQDEKGKPVEVEFEITRAAYERLIAPYVENAIRTCHTLLAKNRLQTANIHRLILIGGPTQTPYIQDQLRRQLNIQLESSIDPMTAVARGAAVFGATQEIPDIYIHKAPSTNPVEVHMEFQPSSTQPSYFVVGTVSGVENRQTLTVELKRQDGGWSSGDVPLDEAGGFAVDVMLADVGRPFQSLFTTTVRNSTGAVLTSVNEPQIWYPYPGGTAPLANSLRVALAGNETEILLRQGQSLPSENTGEFVTNRSLERNKSDEVLRIPIVESVPNLLGEEDDHADCSKLVGTLVIHGAEVARDVPAGSQVEVTVSSDASRLITAKAFVPLLKQEFGVSFNREAVTISLEALELRLNGLSESLDECRELLAANPDPEVANVIGMIDAGEILHHALLDLRRAQEGESRSSHTAYHRSLQLGGTINHIKRLQVHPRLVKHFAEVERGCNDQQRGQVMSLREGYEATPRNDLDALGKIERDLNSVDLLTRKMPMFLLAGDLVALSEERMTSSQLELVERAATVFDRINTKGDNAITKEDGAEMLAIHRQLQSEFPNLDKMVEDKLKTLGGSLEDLTRSHLEKTK